ncbi:MAG: hypothetical protein KDA47_02510, partial [Planctomycetales bacterium]|nr:hypothetical protein [Planctomycetales bacterium]
MPLPFELRIRADRFSGKVVSFLSWGSTNKRAVSRMPFGIPLEESGKPYWLGFAPFLPLGDSFLDLQARTKHYILPFEIVAVRTYLDSPTTHPAELHELDSAKVFCLWKKT